MNRVLRAVGGVCALMMMMAATTGAGQVDSVLLLTAADRSGGRLPGVIVEVVRRAADTAPVASGTTDADGICRITSLKPGAYLARFTLAGFSTVHAPVRIEAGANAAVTATLEVGGLNESVQVTASEVALDVSTSTQTASFSNETLNNLPTASRNYTHVIVSEAGVSAPLPDRTGKGMNIATTPGAQGDDATQSLNPSVNGARPTNNGLRINGVDATNMLNAGGGLGNNVGIPLEALEQVKVQTALPSAALGRNGGGNVELITRSGTNRFTGSAGHYFQHEKMNANEFFLNRAGVEKPKFRRNDTTLTLGGPVLRGRTSFFGAGQRQRFLSGYASNANAAVGLPTGLTDVRTAETIASAANEWLRTGMQDDPRFAQNFMNGLRAFPAEQQAGLIAKFFADPVAAHVP